MMHKSIKTKFAFSLAILGMLFAGLFIGAVTSLLSNIIYIVFLFPLGMGFIGAMAVEKTVTGVKIRKVAQGVLLGGLMAIAIYGAYQFTEYSTFRWRMIFEMDQRIIQETGKSEPLVASVFVDYALKEETGYSGFPGYILYRAGQGVELGRIFGLSRFNLGTFFTWIFWLLELAIIGWITVGVGKTAAGMPFCERCNRWYGKEQHLGGVDEAQAATLLQLFDQGDYTRAGAMLEMETGIPSLEVYAQRCESCSESDTRLTLKRVSLQGGKVKFKPGAQMSARPIDTSSLLRELRFDLEG